jgi:hypothetical protein
MQACPYRMRELASGGLRPELRRQMLHQIALELQQTRTGYDTVLLSRERQLGIFDRVITGPAASPVSFEGIPPCGFRGQNQATQNGAWYRRPIPPSPHES